MKRLAAAVVLGAFVGLSTAACESRKDPPPAKEAAPCTHTNCGECAHEAGCFWCESLKKCTLDKTPGCAEKDLTSDVHDCK